jgi:feruloyl esterase
LPAPDQFFSALVGWVEGGRPPSSIVLGSADGSVTMPACPYPQKVTYNGTGPITAAASYMCK